MFVLNSILVITVTLSTVCNITTAVRMQVKPTFKTGTEIGDQLSSEITDGTATLGFMPDMDKNMVHTKISETLDSLNKKFRYGGDSKSFLQSKTQAQRPVLNLHVAETPSASLTADIAAANQAMSNLEMDEVSRLERLARARQSFLQQKNPSDIQREAVNLASSQQVVDYYSSLLATGAPLSARTGLSGLLKMASLPNAYSLMNFNLNSVLFNASNLAKRESTPDDVRNLCGSLITFLTGQPIVFQSSDVETGAYGHTNIVVPSPSRVYSPDVVIGEIQAGAHAADVV